MRVYGCMSACVYGMQTKFHIFHLASRMSMWWNIVLYVWHVLRIQRYIFWPDVCLCSTHLTVLLSFLLSISVSHFVPNSFTMITEPKAKANVKCAFTHRSLLMCAYAYTWAYFYVYVYMPMHRLDTILCAVLLLISIVCCEREREGHAMQTVCAIRPHLYYTERKKLDYHFSPLLLSSHDFIVTYSSVYYIFLLNEYWRRGVNIITIHANRTNVRTHSNTSSTLI